MHLPSVAAVAFLNLCKHVQHRAFPFGTDVSVHYIDICTQLISVQQEPHI